MSLNRRDFIKQSAVAAALTAAAGPALTKATEKNDPVKWDKAPCRFCGTGCGLLVGTKDDRVVAIKGDPACGVNAGLLCMKGYYAGALMYGKKRLTKPMVRKNGTLQPTSWDEALNLVAEKIMEAPDKFAIYGSGQWTVIEGYTAMKFIKGGLSNNHIDPNARLCMASAVVGFLKTFGVDEPSCCYDDFDLCDTVITWGNNWAEAHPVLFSRFVDREDFGKGTTLIDLATRRTRSTEKSDHYLEFRPHTDLAIANCIAHQLIYSDKWDKEFVEKHVQFKGNDEKPITPEQYKTFLADYTPEKVSELSGVPVEQLKLLGDIFADPKRRVISTWCMGVNQHTGGTALNNLIYNIHLLSGKICKPGSAPFSLTGQPSACGTCREVGTLAHAIPGGRVVANEQHRKEVEDVWKTKPGAINPKPGFHTIAMFKALVAGKLDSLWVQVTNPAQSIPNINENVLAMKGRFVVVSDIYPTLTTKLANVVLPSATWVEKNGIFGNTERRTQQWFKMIDPPGEARDDVWQMLAVARKLYDMGYEGMKNREGEFLFTILDENGTEVKAWEWEEFKKFNVDRALYEEYRPLTFKKRKNVAPYDELVKVSGIRWPVVESSPGVWTETKRRFIEGEDPFVEKGAGVQFYMAKNERAAAFARPYEDPPEMPDAEFPFWLSTGRLLEQWHTCTMTGQAKEIQRAMPHMFVELHPDDAKKLGISTGDTVRVTSRRGKLELPAWIDGRGTPQKGSIFVPFHDPKMLINAVTLDAIDPYSKEPDFKKCAVQVEKVS